jgi:hypothetical protein
VVDGAVVVVIMFVSVVDGAVVFVIMMFVYYTHSLWWMERWCLSS